MARTRRPAQFGPWSGGLNLRVPATDLRPADGRESRGELAVAENIDLDRSGWPSVRAGWTLLDASDAHSAFEVDGVVYAVIDGTLGIITEDGFTGVTPAYGPLWLADVGGRAMVGGPGGLWWLSAGQVAPVAVNQYAAERAEKTVEPMHNGSWLSAWNGRIVVADGASLVFSEPMFYGVCDSARGILPLDSQIQWVAALETGIFVGLKGVVKFLEGRDPYNLTAKVVGGKTVSGAAAVVRTTYMDPQLVKGADRVAVWFSESGFTLGLPDGTVQRPQAERLDIEDLGSGIISVCGDRLILLPT